MPERAARREGVRSAFPRRSAAAPCPRRPGRDRRGGHPPRGPGFPRWSGPHGRRRGRSDRQPGRGRRRPGPRPRWPSSRQRVRRPPDRTPGRPRPPRPRAARRTGGPASWPDPTPPSKVGRASPGWVIRRGRAPGPGRRRPTSQSRLHCMCGYGSGPGHAFSHVRALVGRRPGLWGSISIDAMGKSGDRPLSVKIGGLITPAWLYRVPEISRLNLSTF